MPLIGQRANMLTEAPAAEERIAPAQRTKKTTAELADDESSYVENGREITRKGKTLRVSPNIFLAIHRLGCSMDKRLVPCVKNNRMNWNTPILGRALFHMLGSE